MADEKNEPGQQTHPKGRDKDGKPAEPIEIPVPNRGDVMDLLEKAAKTPPSDAPQ
jgi:hypothetical protein